MAPFNDYGAGLIGAFVLATMWYYLRGFVDSLTAYLYIQGRFDTTITFREAQELSCLFKPNISNKWNPMMEVLDLPVEKRKDYSFSCAYPNGRPDDLGFVVNDDGVAKDIRQGQTRRRSM